MKFEYRYMDYISAENKKLIEKDVNERVRGAFKSKEFTKNIDEAINEFYLESLYSVFDNDDSMYKMLKSYVLKTVKAKLK